MQHFDPAYDRTGSKARITAVRQQRPVYLMVADRMAFIAEVGAREVEAAAEVYQVEFAHHHPAGRIIGESDILAVVNGRNPRFPNHVCRNTDAHTSTSCGHPSA